MLELLKTLKKYQRDNAMLKKLVTFSLSIALLAIVAHSFVTVGAPCYSSLEEPAPEFSGCNAQSIWASAAKAPVTKVVIPAAGLGTRFLPFTKSIPKEMVTVLDKPAIHVIAEEAINSGVSHFLIIVGNHKDTIQDYFSPVTMFTELLAEKNKSHLIDSVQDIIARSHFTYIKQDRQLGLGHAILQAKDAIRNEFFGVILPDDLIVNDEPALAQLTALAQEHNCCIIGVHEVPLESVSSYGIIDIKSEVAPGLYEVKDLIEKPKPENAPSRLAIAGRYVLSDDIFPSLEAIVPSVGGELQLTDAISHMLRANPAIKVYAYKMKGKRYDIGTPLGWAKAIIALALENPLYKDQVKNFIFESLAQK
jgi:UTP--glucose-1-phosphate uridylyltransferase